MTSLLQVVLLGAAPLLEIDEALGTGELKRIETLSYFCNCWDSSSVNLVGFVPRYNLHFMAFSAYFYAGSVSLNQFMCLLPPGFLDRDGSLRPHGTPPLPPTCTLCRDHELSSKWICSCQERVNQTWHFPFWKTHTPYRAWVLTVVIFCMFHFEASLWWNERGQLHFDFGVAVVCGSAGSFFGWIGCDWLLGSAVEMGSTGEERERHCFSPRSIACHQILMLHDVSDALASSQPQSRLLSLAPLPAKQRLWHVLMPPQRRCGIFMLWLLFVLAYRP